MHYNDYISNTDQVFSIHKLMCLEGFGEGVPFYCIDNGSGLSFEVLCARALDIGALRLFGRLVSFVAACGIRHPAYYNASGTEWLRSFGGGMMTTCGLTQCGVPCVLDGEELGMHGRISNTPAQYVGSDVWEENGIMNGEVRGEIHQARHQGEHLVLRRRIHACHGVNRITVSDMVQNRGSKPSPLMLLYHFNFGFPFVSPDISVDIASDKVLHTFGPFERNGFLPPSADAEHQFALYDMVGDPGAKMRATVYDPHSSTGVRFMYASNALPFLAIWKYPCKNDYVLGVEPCNNHVRGAAWEREHGNLRMLMPGEIEKLEITLEFFGESFCLSRKDPHERKL